MMIFLEAMEFNFTKIFLFRAKNYMAFDLGFNNTDPTPEYTAAAIQKMDKRFDLVMITDRFEESIILMRDLLCMSEDDVIYLGMIYKLLVEQLYSQRMSLW